MVLVREAIVHDTHQIKLPGVEPRGALVADVEAKGLHLRLIATHFACCAARAHCRWTLCCKRPVTLVNVQCC